jgi:hypothetical protein
MDWTAILWFFQWAKLFFLASLAVSRLKLGILFRKVRRPESEADVLLTYGAEVKNAWGSNINLHYVFPRPAIT